MVYNHLPSQVELAMVDGTEYCSSSGLPDRYYGYVTGVENPKDTYVTPIFSIKVALNLVSECEVETATTNSVQV